MNQMKKIYTIVYGFLLISLMASCLKDHLDLAPVSQVNDVLLWQNQSMVQVYTANFYAQLPNDNSSFYTPAGFTPWLVSDITDDGDAANPAVGSQTFFTGAYDASSSPVNSIWAA